jgi:addiction module RelE/StbE family toxin
MDKEENLNQIGLSSVRAGFKDVEQNRLYIRDPNDLYGNSIREALSHLVCNLESPPEPEWYLGFTDEFIKMTDKIDRKLQGRILNAIRELVKHPDKPKGDTIKPLQAEIKGLWRYRIGDYRLIYQPDSQKKCVFLLSFLSRKVTCPHYLYQVLS